MNTKPDMQRLKGKSRCPHNRNIYAPVLGVQIVNEWLDNLDIAPETAVAQRTD